MTFVALCMYCDLDIVINQTMLPCQKDLEYTDFILCRGGLNPPHAHQKKKCPKYDTKLHLMVSLQFWSSGE